MLNDQTTNTHLSLAPFRGITHKAYRNAFARHFCGIDVFYAPFISGTGTGRIHPSKCSDIMPLSDGSPPVIPQIISNNATEIISFGRAIYRAGYRELNWNLGCPFDRIANKRRGCGMLPFPEEIEKILSDVFTADIFRDRAMRFSVKTRLGYRCPSEIGKVLEVLNQFAVCRIVIHPRTGEQIYSGKADPEKYAGCVGLSRHPLVYNGDIVHLTGYRTLQTMLPGQKEWMLGRGALINPFLPARIRGREIAAEEKTGKLRSFHEELWTHVRTTIPREQQRLGAMKAIWHYLSGVMHNSKDVCSLIKRARTEKEYLVAVKTALEQRLANDQQIEKHFRCLTEK